MTEINVLALEPHRFGVAIDEGGTTTNHEVRVDTALLDDLGVLDPDIEDEAEAVRETIGFLLDRQPATAIEGSFSMQDVARRYPGFTDELRTRLADLLPPGLQT